MKSTKTAKIATCLNIIDLLAVSLALFIAFIFQFALKELPCPLCLLQRLGLLAMSFGFLLNVRYCIKPNHYAFILLAALFTAAVSLRQVLLHIVPGTGAYGDAFLGLHLYTWMFLISCATILYTAIILCIPDQYTHHSAEIQSPLLKTLGHFAFLCLFSIAAANVVSVWLECGLKECPENPVTYKI